MKNRHKSLPAIYLGFFLFVALTGCDQIFSRKPKKANSQANIADPVVFSGKTVDGETVKLTDYRGKIVLVDFWATWCGPCVQWFPHSKKLLEKYEGKPFAIVGISIDDSASDLKSFLKRSPHPWKNIHDADQEIASDWDVRAIPGFLLLDEKGVVHKNWIGTSVDPATVDREIDFLLEKIK
ncbi:MAG: TlpA disulfide reductase family protein [Zavarzinella sp.]